MNDYLLGKERGEEGGGEGRKAGRLEGGKKKGKENKHSKHKEQHPNQGEHYEDCEEFRRRTVPSSAVHGSACSISNKHR